jgi:hypothetical protein
MKSKLLVGAMALALTASGTGAAVAASKKQGPAPTHANVNAVQKLTFKVNRYVKDALRWQKDTYQIKSGGTLHIVNKANDGPHTFSIVAKKDLPRTVKQINECSICQTIGEQHGVTDPNSDAPPPFNYTNDGVGTNDATTVGFDKPGDSVFVGPAPGDSADAKITAKKGTKLYFMCAIHPWMQAKVIVQ